MSFEVFTTGQVAKMCKVAPKTVSNWFDNGKLKGYRVPGAQDRRIPRVALDAFLEEHGICPVALEENLMPRCLLVSPNTSLAAEIGQHFSDQFKVVVAADSYQAGWLVQERAPRCLLLDTEVGPAGVHATLEGARQKVGKALTSIALIHDSLTFRLPAGAVNQSFTLPVNVQGLYDKILPMVRDSDAYATAG